MNPVPKDLVALEKEILGWWKSKNIFEKSLSNRINSPNFIFYDGPPFATGLPHYGHLVPNTLKDLVPRYWTMRGYRVERKFGWDTHGLPIELLVEKQLNLSGPNEIIEYGIDNFNETCRENVLTYTEEWKRIIGKLGRWVDFENGYKTMDLSFMESVWWVFSEIFKKGLVYQDFKVMPYSCRLSTALSNFEASQNYKNIQSTTLTVGMIDAENQDIYLIWTTTPWTLPCNLAVGIHPEHLYLRVRLPNDERIFVIGKERAHLLGENIEVLEEKRGEDLLGRKYLPLFPYFKNHKNGFQLISASFIESNSGTGLVHLAPDFGEEDFLACKFNQIEVLHPLNDDGSWKNSLSDFAGQKYNEIKDEVISYLKNQKLLFKRDTVDHSYPHCWRSGDPLIYRAMPAWFVNVESLKTKMIELNSKINWVPAAIGQKRFANWLEQAKDWNISRNRFWGTPIPIWKCNHCNKIICISSVQELEKNANRKIEDLHPHKIDDISWQCLDCQSGRLYRIKEVFDCWFESGAMPYAQSHYPFENSNFQFPAHFVAEGLDQTRGWFYTLLVLSTALFENFPFENCIVNGLVLAEDGSKMSKSKNNYRPVEEILDLYGADALRLSLINSPLIRAEPLKFSEELIKNSSKDLIIPIHNAWNFFVQYVNLENWKPSEISRSKNKLDLWILSTQQTLIKSIDLAMEKYHIYEIVPLLIKFIDDVNNWYIRLSRKRFQKSNDFDDRNDAFNTLYSVLKTLSKLLAPFTPFLAEGIHQSLSCLNSQKEVESVHLCDWPQSNQEYSDLKLEDEISLVRNVVNLGRKIRERLKIKIRQPLGSITINHPSLDILSTLEKNQELVLNELNLKKIILKNDVKSAMSFRADFSKLGKRLGKKVKTVAKEIEKISMQDWLNKSEFLILDEVILKEEILAFQNQISENSESDGLLIVELDSTLTKDLLSEGLIRELISLIQDERKQLGFEATEQICIYYNTDNEYLQKTIELNRKVLEDKLCAKLSFSNDSQNKKVNVSANVGSFDFEITLFRSKELR